MKRNIFLKLTNEGVFYNEQSMVKWEQTNFPDKTHFKFNEYRNVFWEMEMISYDKNEKALLLKVVDYQATDFESFKNQKAKASIDRFIFDKIDWEELQYDLSFYVSAQFEKLCNKEEELQSEKEISQIIPPKELSLPPVKSLLIKRRTSLYFDFPLQKMTFKMGYVEFDYYVDKLLQTITVRLWNDNIIPEFNYIKSFFAKAIGTRKVNINGYVELKGEEILEVKCSSKEIQKINEELITSVRRLRLKALIQQPHVLAVDKSLFSPQEFFEDHQDVFGDITQQSDLDILKEIIQLKGTRNRKQLEYLAGKLQNLNMAIKFTLSPNFGFLFYVPGQEMDHFIWELLNSHATYIWSIDKAPLSLEKKYKLVEQKINFIKDQGRLNYIRNENFEDLIFSRVNHENANSKLIDPFPKWKIRLNEKLV